MEVKQSKPGYQTQQQRWLKYGSNVALAIVVVIALAAMLVSLAQRFDKRFDVTSSGLYSLKPQTVSILKDLKQKIKLVSLYQAKTVSGQPNPNAGPVNDLLKEYASKGNGVDFEVVDPITQPGKTDEIVTEAIGRYGGATKAYSNFVGDFSKSAAELKNKLTDEAAAVASIEADKLGADDRGQTLAAIVQTVRDLPSRLSTLQTTTDRAVKVKNADYKKIVDRIKDSLDVLSQSEAAVIKFAGQYKADTAVPDALRKYLADSEPRHVAIKKLIDDTTAKSNSLGELKTGELTQAIKSQDIVLVMGENDYRVVDNSQIWVTDARDVRQYTEGQELKPRFAGEQAITTAILGVASPTKPKVVFVRPGGAPLANPGMPPFIPGGPFGELATRLKAYNFQVLEKDLSGMYAMQAQMQGQQAEPEPSDAEIKDAVWICLDVPSRQPAPGGNVMATKLAAHLKDGGSALVLALRGGDALAPALKDFGIELQTDLTAVHEAIQSGRVNDSDVIENVLRVPYFFLINQFESNIVTNSLQSLDTLLAYPSVVKTSAAAGVTNSPMLKIPQVVPIWGERNLESRGDTKPPTFDAATDVPPPLYTGAMAERDKSRLIVYGNLYSFTSEIMNVPDDEMLKRRVVVARFPGNAELFSNSVFWLAKMEPMIAISPAAMQVSRIAPMTDGTLAMWRVGVLLIILPGLVIAAGVMVYFQRRD